MKKHFVPALFLLSIFFTGTACQANDLAIGNSAKVTDAVDIEIVPPANFNFKPMAEIFNMRKKEVLKHANLLKGGYAPDNGVFGQAENNRPWWGTIGQAYYGSGQKSIVGPAMQSQFILNPFLLAGLWGVLGLPKDRISEASLAYKSYPTLIQATKLRWWPKESKAEVTYLISDYMNRACSMFGYSSMNVPHGVGSLALINARDLGLRYVYIPPNWAQNMRISSPMGGAMAIPQYIHCGGSCGYPGGCNNMSPAVSWLDDIEVTKLPAKLYLLFWKNPPASIRQPADMMFTLHFQ